jgi:hypothetical protein
MLLVEQHLNLGAEAGPRIQQWISQLMLHGIT